MVRQRDQNSPGKITEVSPASYTHRKPTQMWSKDQVATSPTWRGTVLVWSQQNYQMLLKTVRYFETS